MKRKNNIKLDQIRITSFITSEKLMQIKGGDDHFWTAMEGPCPDNKDSGNDSGCMQCSH